ncbi:jg6026 [Pararge aegeria aegeria]|uniref:Jg6026 protein n=1 Tax=Pararge aegeria aegeria TaxID=348720 RepID=A0A8S4QDG9_9NEOP|nr:jg6026 [Pararge aegeria aegeria]
MGISCAVNGCYSSGREDHRAFFRFPKNLALCRQWIEAAGRQDLESKDIETIHKNYRICDIHFEPSQRLNNRLRANAIPICSLPETSDEIDNRTKSSQTEIAIDSCFSVPSTSTVNSCNVTTQSMQCENTSRKRKLSSTSLNPFENESITQECDIPFQETTSKFVVAHKRIEFIVNRLKQVYPGELFHDEYKKFVTKLYFSSPLAYRFLYKALNLPSEKMLRKDNIIDVGPNLSDSMIRCLQYKCKQLSTSERICVLSLGRMELKWENIGPAPTNKTVGCNDNNGSQTNYRAKHAIVLMARGLFSKWVQPIAFCFSKPAINYPQIITWAYEIIEKTIQIGFDVVAVTTDNEPLFYNMTKNDPCFSFNNSKSYLIFDVPQLINSLRNVFLANNFIYRDGSQNELSASWDDIISIFQIEKKKKKQRLAYNLTVNHTKPSTFEKSVVKFAAQVFSRSVALAIQSNIGPEKLSEKALGTANFVQRLSDVFDILNSSPNTSSDEYNKGFSGERFQTNTLQEFIRMLCQLRVISKSNKDETIKVRCLVNFKTTIHSILLLSKDLKTKGYNYFYTRRLNTDVLKDFFKTVSQNRGVCRETTPGEFYEDFKKHFLHAAIDTHTMNNSTSELNELFSELKEIYKQCIETCKELQVNNELFEIISQKSEESEEDENEWFEIISNHSEEIQEEDNESIDVKPSQCEESNEKYVECIDNKPNQSVKSEEKDNELIEIKKNESEHNELIEQLSNEREKSDKDNQTNNSDEKVIFIENNSNQNEEDNEIKTINDEIENILTRRRIDCSVEAVGDCLDSVFEMDD